MKLFLPVIIALALFSGCAVSREQPDANEQHEIRILAFNIHHGAPRNSEVVNLDDAADAIKSQKADLIALQEVDKHTQRSGQVYQAKALAEKLHMEYYFSKSIDYQGGDYGVAILSKYPIESSKQIMLPNAHPKGEQRTLAYVTVKLPDGSELDFASVHLDLVKANRADQCAFLVDLAEKTNNPLIIAGDFNGQPQDTEIKTLHTAYQASCTGNCPLTFPSNKADRTIDYIFNDQQASKKFSQVTYRALAEEQCSDHLPLLGVYTY